MNCLFSTNGSTGRTNLGAATSATYTPSGTDVGNYLRSVVIGYNPYGGPLTGTPSAATAAIIAAPPTNSVLPVISGTAQSGSVLTTTNGTWANSPTGYTYQWARCTAAAGGTCSNVGTSATTYTLVPADIGSFMQVTVTATNSGGSNSAISSRTAVVVANPNPAFNGAIGAANSTSAGSTLVVPVSAAAAVGTAVMAFGAGDNDVPTSVTDSKGNGYVRFNYRPTLGVCCNQALFLAIVSQALTTSDTVTFTWAGSQANRNATLDNFNRVEYVSFPADTVNDYSSNGGGVAQTALSGGTGNKGQAIAYGSFVTNGPPTDTWTAGSGYTLTGGANGSGNASSTINNEYKFLPGGANVFNGDATINNARDYQAFTSSMRTGDGVTAVPANSVAPAISGTASVGSVLTLSNGTWSGAPTRYAYEFKRCDSAGANCNTSLTSQN